MEGNPARPETTGIEKAWLLKKVWETKLGVEVEVGEKQLEVGESLTDSPWSYQGIAYVKVYMFNISIILLLNYDAVTSCACGQR